MLIRHGPATQTIMLPPHESLQQITSYITDHNTSGTKAQLFSAFTRNQCKKAQPMETTALLYPAYRYILFLIGRGSSSIRDDTTIQRLNRTVIVLTYGLFESPQLS